MIDVIFQLVLFFVFSMKFLAFEGQINAFLPKDRGTTQASFSKEMQQVTLFLDWEPANGGAVLARTFNYEPPGGGPKLDNYTFPMDAGVQQVAGKDGPQTVTKTTMTSAASRKRGGRVEYDYGAPDFAVIEAYLSDQKKAYDTRSGLGAGLQVTISFVSQTPWQMVVNVVDICARVGITNFALNPLEIDY
jgi:biopolymer transport protein ExbD